MNKEMSSKLVTEIIHIVILFFVALIIGKIALYEEPILMLFKAIAGIFWIFILPGFAIMYWWHNKLTFLERFIIGVPTGSAIIGVLSYYSALALIPLRIHGALLPLLIIVYMALFYKKWGNIEQ